MDTNLDEFKVGEEYTYAPLSSFNEVQYKKYPTVILNWDYKMAKAIAER